MFLCRAVDFARVGSGHNYPGLGDSPVRSLVPIGILLYTPTQTLDLSGKEREKERVREIKRERKRERNRNRNRTMEPAHLVFNNIFRTPVFHINSLMYKYDISGKTIEH